MSAATRRPKQARAAARGAEARTTAATAAAGGVREALAWLGTLAPRGDLRLDSRGVQRGDVFVAVPGARTDGRDHLHDAIERGAAAALVDADGWIDAEQPVPVRAVAGLRDELGALAADFYGDPSAQITTIAVTGTNGKTSCSQWVAQLLSHAGRRCAVVGTVGIGFPGELAASELTTPDAVSLQRELHALRDAGAQAVAMEVSSIGLAQHRVDGMHFDVAVFTNLTRDHLDVHGTMQRYEAAKAQLFDWPGLAHAVINLDDAAGRRLAERLQQRPVAQRPAIIGYSVGASAQLCAIAPRVTAHAIRATADGLAFELRANGQVHAVEVPLVGHFNVANLLAVTGVALACGMDVGAAAAMLPQLVPPPGRMQRMAAPGAPLVVVDYAHTPDALTQALAALRPLVQARAGRLWVVFGAGGDRDPGKRAPMGAAAAVGADVVVVTSDNPRSEDPEAIVAQVAAGAGAARELLREVDRACAIATAVARAGAADVVLIAGKGHEDYQIVGRERRAFSDIEHARTALMARAA